MKEFFEEFLKLLAGCVVVICLAFASFLLLSNFYHYKEISHTTLFDFNENATYKEYKTLMAKVDKKMKSVNIDDVKYDSTAKVIYNYYEGCSNSLKKGTFNNLTSKNAISTLDVYKSNDEILKDYNRSCVFGIPYNITIISKSFNLNNSSELFKTTEEKRHVIIDNAEYLTRAQLGNSSYGFITDTTRGAVYDKTRIELGLTIDNYRLMASILNDVADWYVDEFGGNR